MKIEIEDLIREQIENMNLKELVRDEIKKLISAEVKREISVATKKEIDGIIATEIDIEMGKEIDIDDGWGKREHFDTFSDLFKTTFKKSVTDSSRIRNIIAERVKTRTDEIVKDNLKQFTDMLLNQLTGTTTNK